MKSSWIKLQRQGYLLRAAHFLGFAQPCPLTGETYVRAIHNRSFFSWRLKTWLGLVWGMLITATGQEADAYLNRIIVTPNAFVAGSSMEIRVDLKQFSSFLYRGIFWQVSFDGTRFQSIGDAQQVGGDFSLTYVFTFNNIPASPFLLRAGIVTESFVVPGSTTTDYTSAVRVDPLAQGQPGAIGFQVAVGAVSEAIGTATVQVSRTGGASGVVGVTYTLVNGTAVGGKDFVAASGTVNFKDGETTGTFAIQIMDDSLVEGDEAFSVVLSQPTGGATLGQIPVLEVTIQDNDVQSISPPQLLSPQRQAGGAFTFQLMGKAGQTYTVERSINLRDWEFLSVVTGAALPVPVIDPNADSVHRFYRAQAQ